MIKHNLLKIGFIGRGLDWLFETRPLEDILADIAVGWKQIQKEDVTPTPAWAYNVSYEL